VGSVSPGRARDGRSGDGDGDCLAAHPCGQEAREGRSELGRKVGRRSERATLTCGASGSSDSWPRLLCAGPANHGAAWYRIHAASRKDGPSRCAARPARPAASPGGGRHRRNCRETPALGIQGRKVRVPGTCTLAVADLIRRAPGASLPAPDCRGRPCLSWEQPTGPGEPWYREYLARYRPNLPILACPCPCPDPPLSPLVRLVLAADGTAVASARPLWAQNEFQVAAFV
jgi:hypothetical protein